MENKKPKHIKHRSSGSRFGVMDLVILIVVGMATFGTIFGWVYESLNREDEEQRTDTCVVTFRIDETHREVLAGLSYGDQVYLSDDDSFMGYLRDDLTVTDVSDKPAFLARVTGTGSMVCVGQEDDGTIRIGDHTLTAGDVLTVRTERELLTIHVLSVSRS